MTLNAPPSINYINRDYDGALTDLDTLLTLIAPDLKPAFDSGAGEAIKSLLAALVDKLSYHQDLTAHEVFPAIARRLQSQLRWARTVGYTPGSAKAATVLMTLPTLPDAVVANGATIAANTALTTSNGLRYETTALVTIDAGLSSTTVKLTEGESLEETFTPSGEPELEILTARGVVEDGSWDVFVGDTAISTNLWSQKSFVALEDSATKTYEVSFDGEGRLRIRFGDGEAGQIPDDTITVRYRVCNGELGNREAGTMSGSLKATVIGTGQVVGITTNNDANPATGGIDREDVVALRKNIPAFIRSMDHAGTIDDYAALLANTVALVFTDVHSIGFDGNVVRVCIWDEETVTFTSADSLNGLSSSSSYSRYVQAPSNRSNEVQAVLRPRTIATVHNAILRPDVAQVDLDLGNVSYDTLNDPATVHAAVVAAVVEVFEESSGFEIRLADIYEAVLGVTGVKHFIIKQVVYEHTDFATGNTTVTETMRTDQDVNGLDGGPYDPITDIIIPNAKLPKFYDDTYLYNHEITYELNGAFPAMQAINLRSLAFNLTA